MLQSGRRIKVLYFSISIFTSLHWAETETELLFHAQMRGNKDSTSSCKTPEQACIFKGYTTAFLGPAPFSPALRPGPLLFRMMPPQGSNLTVSFLFSLCFYERRQQANTFSLELTTTTVIVPPRKQAYSIQQKLPVFQGAAGEINTAMTLGQILNQQWWYQHSLIYPQLRDLTPLLSSKTTAENFRPVHWAPGLDLYQELFQWCQRGRRLKHHSSTPSA